jgi:YVTN family beta-propeller protein
MKSIRPRGPVREVVGLLSATRVTLAAVIVSGLMVASCSASGGHSPAAARPRGTSPRATLPPRPTTSTSFNVYANATGGKFASAVQGVPARVYVPNSVSNTVDVIDPATFTIISRFRVPTRPQHVVPSWDLRTLYVNSDVGNALTPIDPRTGRPGRPIPVTDPYNLYFTPDGTKAIVVPELLSSLDFRDPHTFALIKRVPLPCRYPNHMDFTADGRSAVVSCEASRQVARVDVVTMQATGVLTVGGSPQDVRLSPDGTTFYVADQDLGGVDLIDARTFTKVAFIKTGAGAHGIYPSRDANRLYVSNRVAGTISVIDPATRRIVYTWIIPHGSPDMGGVTPDGSQLWLSGRYNSEVYVIDTATGVVRRIPVGLGPHGLCVFPQPGRISLGHTGNYR